jgi:hypothetical protein
MMNYNYGPGDDFIMQGIQAMLTVRVQWIREAGPVNETVIGCSCGLRRG